MSEILIALRDGEAIDCSTAARKAGVSHETIRRWCEHGIIPSCKLYGRWKIDRAKFEVWLNRQRVYTPHPSQQLNLF